MNPWIFWPLIVYILSAAFNEYHFFKGLSDMEEENPDNPLIDEINSNPSWVYHVMFLIPGLNTWIMLQGIYIFYIKGEVDSE